MAAASSPAQARDEAFSVEFLQQHCVACHNDSNRTANITVTPLDPNNVALHADVWEKVLRKVRTAEMPPPTMPQPEASAAAEFTAELRLALDAAAAAKPDPGRTTIHRLNRIEYANAVRDLLAIDIDADDSLPADDTGYGFDNIADVLSVSPILLERYMSVARSVSRLAVGATDITPGQEAWRLERRGNGRLNVQRVSDTVPFGSRGGMAVTYYFPVDAEYVIEFDVRVNQFPQEKPYQIRLPMTAGNHTVAATFFANSARSEMTAPRSRLRRGPAAALPETAMLDIRIDGARYKLEELAIDNRLPQVYAAYIEGPYNITGPGDTRSRRIIFSCDPEGADQEEPCAREILTRLAGRAYRRPVSNDDVSPLMGIYQVGFRDGGFEGGIQRALEAMLVSPNFLFRVERDPTDAKPGDIRQITDLELASRLSFFLWSSIPDQELLSIAEEGKLRHSDVLKAQVKRMIADRRAASLIENFAGQWLFLRKVDTTTPDADRFGSFDNTLREAMRKETELLFEEVLKGDRSVLELLSADYTYLNEQLAGHYDVDGVYGPQMRRVAIDNPNRYGLLGHASILTVTSYANRTSVVQRGAWILDNLLGTPPPPPPPNVPSLDAVEGGENLTLRQSMELHRTNAVCASCHARMDPIGFALENFDAIGRWRDEDAGDPIDTSGELPDGTKFDGPQGLRQLMLDDYKTDFVAAATEKLLTYALGRGLEHYDQPIVRSIMRNTADTDYRMSDLVMKVVESTPFQMRRSTER